MDQDIVCSGLACQPVLYSYSSSGNLAVVIASGAFLSFFTFATPLLIHSISKKYVTKLYYNQVNIWVRFSFYIYNVCLLFTGAYSASNILFQKFGKSVTFSSIFHYYSHFLLFSIEIASTAQISYLGNNCYLPLFITYIPLRQINCFLEQYLMC